MLTLGDVLSLAPGVISRESGGELVLVLPEQGKFVVLNGTGSEVFRLVDGLRTLDEIAAALSERYNVPLEQAQTDVLTFARKLMERGALRRPGENQG